LAAEYQKILNLQNSFVDREHAHNSVLNFVTFFTLGGIVLGFAQNSFEKWLVAASRFSKSSMQIRKMFQPTVLGELHSAVFKRS
jgi:hypothetical protein